MHSRFEARLSWPIVIEDCRRFTLPVVRPFAARAATMASADFSLRRPCSQRRPFGRKARPPWVRAPTFAARPPDLRRLSLGHESFAIIGSLALLGAASIRFLFVGPQLRSTLPSRRPRGPTLCASLRFARRDQLTRGLPPPSRCPCRAHKKKAGAEWPPLRLPGSRADAGQANATQPRMNFCRSGLSTNSASATTMKFMIAVMTNTICQPPVADFTRLATGTRNAEAPLAV